MSPHPLTNFKIQKQKYYQNKPEFKVDSSRSNLPKKKELAYVINIDEYKSVGTRWIALFVNDDNVTYFDSFGTKCIPKEIKRFIGNKT